MTYVYYLNIKVFKPNLNKHLIFSLGEVFKMNQSVLKAIEVLNCFTKKKELSIIELSKMTSIPKTTIFRLVSSLEKGGLLGKRKKSSHDVTYHLGFRILELGKILMEQLDFRNIAIPHMKNLNQSLNELVHLVAIEGDMAVYVETIDSTKPLRLVVKVGKKAPLYAGSAPKLLLAYMEDDALSEYLETITLEKLTENTIDNIDDLKSELQNIRTKGYSISNAEHFPNTIGFSFPVYDHNSSVIASLGVSIPETEYTESRQDEILNKVGETAKLISYDLGFKVNE